MASWIAHIKVPIVADTFEDAEIEARHILRALPGHAWVDFVQFDADDPAPGTDARPARSGAEL